MSTPTFADLGVPAPIAQRLADRGIDAPFEIQVATIPDALAGLDLCGKAPTGSGKTIAFGIPLVANVKRAAPKRPKGLVLAPTRELALQVADELTLLGDQRVLAVYGGANIEPQIKKLRAGVDIVVACPGRLLDVIDRKACDLRDVSFVVIDEADRMADMGFLPEVRRILDQTASKRQTLLFSATLDGAVDTLVKQYQTNPAVYEMAEEDRGHISHHFWRAERSERVQLAAETIERVGPTVVFSRTKHGADRIARQLDKLGVSAAAIHGNRSQAQRERALNSFHHGEVQALVATDVAARGIHVEGVKCVLHFDIPADPKDYVHRSGRTGRAGEDGTVVALVGSAQHKDAKKLARQADVHVDITDPDVASLPAGFEAFAEARARKAKTKPSRESSGVKPNRSRGAKSERSGRSDRPERRERSDRQERSERPTRSRSRHGGERRSGGDADGRPREDRAARGERRSGEESRAGSGGRPVGDRPSGGGSKPRPSGAARRKAKRAAMAAAGEVPNRSKNRRSGKPRPPRSGGSGRSSASRSGRR